MGRPTHNDLVLQAMRSDFSMGGFYVLSFEKRSIIRSQAMERLQPMIDKLDQCTMTADFVTEVETSFTKESVKVLPQHAKRTIRLAAEVVGNEKILKWIAAAKQDKEEHTWEERIETPQSPAGISPQVLDDLGFLVHVAPSNIQDILRSRVEAVKMLFDMYEERIREITTISETNIATSQQLREELLERPPAVKRGRKVPALRKPKSRLQR
ncbi:hypothetical protein HDV63DRAFT_415958 [Trichoderma sp. SZMC 28014]